MSQSGAKPWLEMADLAAMTYSEPEQVEDGCDDQVINAAREPARAQHASVIVEPMTG